MKYAMSMDGKIATRTGSSRYVTNEFSRNEVQKMRHKYRGIMAGIGTVLADDPMLNTRIEGLRSPVRIICDSELRIPLTAGYVRLPVNMRRLLPAAMPLKTEYRLLKHWELLCCRFRMRRAKLI